MKLTSSLIFASTLCVITLLSSQPVAAKDDTKKAHKSYSASKKVPAMRNRVYAQLARAQALADEGNKQAGFQVLDQVKERLNSLNSYERAMLFNFYGFMHYANEELSSAISSFKLVVAEQSIPDSLITSTLYSLAQLSMQQKDYTAALDFLHQWQQVNAKELSPSQAMFFAQVYYQDKLFVDALMYIENAIVLAANKDKKPKENWLILKRATHYELNQPKQVTKVMEQLVRWYDKPQYWLQLSAMYGEVGEENKQMAVMEAALQAGYVTKSSDIITLSQLYLFHGAPFKSAHLLAEAIAQGTVVAQEKSLDLLARAYLAAKEDFKAIKVFKELSNIVDDGQYDAMLAQTYLNNEHWQEAINYAGSAIKKSKTVNTNSANYLANMYLAQGIANFNLNNFQPSLTAFAQATAFVKVKKTAQQWRKYVEREQKNYQQLQVRLAMLN
ncbi:MAG: hypothetical protein COB83_04470 [Gammaproteobacteria bacterium]|nr:MAG: hypothetical protein COB83_04470 [Gammaproteobacteria bacterium]